MYSSVRCLRALMLLMLLACTMTFRPGFALAQGALQPLVQSHSVDLAKPSRQSIGAVKSALLATDHPEIADFLRKWDGRRPEVRKERLLTLLVAQFSATPLLAKNIFGTQARPLTSPDWLGGAITLNDIVGISTIRVAIFVLALICLMLLVHILKRTRLGLEVRAVTQNAGMAASMGIKPDRINMLTFGLGSGIAGIAGVTIGLDAQVTSEMGANYIFQSFMTVVMGGVGDVWGTLAGAMLIGFLQKGIECLKPSNTLAAQTWMVLFVILCIQFRPGGIVALKGRAAGD